MKSTIVTLLNAGTGDTIAAVAGTVALMGDPADTIDGPTVMIETAVTDPFSGAEHFSVLF